MIEASGLTKYYGSASKRFTAVNGVSFHVAPSTVFGLLGPNGAGKSTAIRMLTTLSRPDSGRCVIDGIDLTSEPMEIKKRIGVVPQENNLDRELSAYENLWIYGMLHRVVHLPEILEKTISILPLTHTNILIRKNALDGEGFVSLAIQIAYAIAFFILGSRLIRQYSE